MPVDGDLVETGDLRELDAHDVRRAEALELDPEGLQQTTPGASRVRGGARFRDTPEALRISPLTGDSATFDFSPYRGAIDLVYIDASHSYSYVKADTEAALAMLSPSGTIVWDDYTYYPGIYAYLNELAPTLGRPIYHLLGTRLAVYTQSDLLTVGSLATAVPEA